MQGQTCYVKIYRERRVADDESGGAETLGYWEVSTSGRARIQQRPATLEMRAQGLGTDKFYDALVQPATLDIQAKDVLTPADGPFQMVEFLVTAVINPPMDACSPRAHLKLQLERYDEGKILLVR